MDHPGEEDLETLDKLIDCDNKNDLYKVATVINIPEIPIPKNPSSNGLTANHHHHHHLHHKESLLGSFNKHLRHSIRAINESPSAITRCDNVKAFFIH